MQEHTEFRKLIEQARQGDEKAAWRLWTQYEPAIRREVRFRLTDQRLRRLIDSDDFCQSVFANFFARVAMGQMDIAEPAQLVRLLTVMAANRVTDFARWAKAARRDQDREQPLDEDNAQPSPVSTPSEQVVLRDMLEQFQQRLTDEEQAIAEHRRAGLNWIEIAERIGGTADSNRKRFTRAMDRIATELGLEQHDGPEQNA